MKIAIIGSGISSLYLAHKLLKKNYDFDIYEKNNNIGGRIKVVDFDGLEVVAGAGILRFNKDKLMLKLCKELNVETHNYKTEFSYTFKPLNVLEIIGVVEVYDVILLVQRLEIISRISEEARQDHS